MVGIFNGNDIIHRAAYFKKEDKMDVNTWSDLWIHWLQGIVLSFKANVRANVYNKVVDFVSV